MISRQMNYQQYASVLSLPSSINDISVLFQFLFDTFIANFALSIPNHYLQDSTKKIHNVLDPSCLLSKLVSQNNIRNITSHTSTPFLVETTSFDCCTHFFESYSSRIRISIEINSVANRVIPGLNKSLSLVNSFIKFTILRLL